MAEAVRLGDLLVRHAEIGSTETATPGVRIMRLEITTEPLGLVARPSLAFVINRATEAVLGDDRFVYGARQSVAARRGGNIATVPSLASWGLSPSTCSAALRTTRSPGRHYSERGSPGSS